MELSGDERSDLGHCDALITDMNLDITTTERLTSYRLNTSLLNGSRNENYSFCCKNENLTFLKKFVSMLISMMFRVAPHIR